MNFDERFAGGLNLVIRIRDWIRDQSKQGGGRGLPSCECFQVTAVFVIIITVIVNCRYYPRYYCYYDHLYHFHYYYLK